MLAVVVEKICAQSVIAGVGELGADQITARGSLAVAVVRSSVESKRGSLLTPLGNLEDDTETNQGKQSSIIF